MAFFVFVWATLRRFREYMRDPEFRGLLFAVLILLLTGMFLFRYLEGWSYLDSLYFSLISLTTVGYGDFTPQTTAGKSWAMVYIVAGIGVISAFIAQLVAKNRERHRSNVANAQQQLLEAQAAVQKLVADIEQSSDSGAQSALDDLLMAQDKLHDALADLTKQKQQEQNK